MRAHPKPNKQYALITRLQQLRHFTHKAFRLRHWCEARSHDASLINQELREVPFYAVAQQPALLLPKPNVEGVGVLACLLSPKDLQSGYCFGRCFAGLPRAGYQDGGGKRGLHYAFGQFGRLRHCRLGSAGYLCALRKT
jgi:hypothetical protein